MITLFQIIGNTVRKRKFTRVDEWMAYMRSNETGQEIAFAKKGQLFESERAAYEHLLSDAKKRETVLTRELELCRTNIAAFTEKLSLSPIP